MCIAFVFYDQSKLKHFSKMRHNWSFFVYRNQVDLHDGMEVHAFAAHEPHTPLQPFSYKSRNLEPNEVRVQITHGGVCHSDIHSVDNDWGVSTYPLVPGHEIVGIISEKGSAVGDEFKIGARVGLGPQIGCCFKCDYCKNRKEQLCGKFVQVYGSKDPKTGEKTHGGFSTSVISHKHFVFQLPDSLPSVFAPPLFCAGLTVFSPLKHAKAKPGDRVGVVGIGGLGHLAIQLASRTLR
eukprot:TRINITY_DN7463_c0_g1_i2.p1 TRINITY_DN7463_c0_g1~~TRINITY_DN7463_c0_g1_i2.p1  ORF type:complete len:237 (+),score=30.08 TRINITY_DN7463_c0_g1_i2:10-720(+)